MEAGGFASWVEAASLSDPHKTQVLGEWAMGLIHKILVKFSNPAAKPLPYTEAAFKAVLGGISPAANPTDSTPWASGMGWDSGEGVSPSASPTGGRDLVWAALGHRSVTGEPADQHEVQVHQIHRPRLQPGADPHHRRYPAGHSLQEEGGHVSGKPGNRSLQIAPLCTGAKLRGRGETHKHWGDSCCPVSREFLPV